MKKISKWGVALVLFFTLSLFSLPVIMAEDWQSVADTTVQLFIKYLSIDTTNPPGDVSEAAEFLHQMLQKEGISSELIWTDKKTGRVNVLARLEGNGDKPPLLMLNHMDAVPVDRSGWSVDPFKGIKKNGYIYGRGALDMKNFGIVQLMSMILLKRNNVPLERDGFFPGPVSMEEYRTIHGNDERIRESSLRSAVRIYYNVVKSFCKSIPNTL